MSLKELMDLGMLNECAYECTKQSHWKEATQRYLSNLLLNNMQLQKDVLEHRYKVMPTTNFILNERGRMRYIEAPAVRDRIVQKTVTKNVLIPCLLPYVIYDNYASIKNRGTSFARKRMEIMLRRYLQKNGSDGYILLIDIKKYFESIDHEILKAMIYPKIANEDQDVIDLINYIIDTSSHSDKGLNLGSEAPQILALYYLTLVDTFVKVVKGVKYYGRYMDDIFIIGKSKKELHLLLGEIENVVSTLKLEINKKKTHILKLRHGFTFLQIKYDVLSNKKILKRLTRKKVTRERRRLKALRRIADKGIINDNNAYECYKSWRGTIVKDHNACYKSLNSMDKVYLSLFTIPSLVGKRSRMSESRKIFNKAKTEHLKQLIK